MSEPCPECDSEVEPDVSESRVATRKKYECECGVVWISTEWA